MTCLLVYRRQLEVDHEGPNQLEPPFLPITGNCGLGKIAANTLVLDKETLLLGSSVLHI